MTELAPLNQNATKARLQYEAGELALSLIKRLSERYGAEDCPTPDLHKGLELSAKIMGIKDNERMDNLPTIVWNIAGGNVTVEMAAAPTTSDADIIDVVAKESPEPTPSKPGKGRKKPDPDKSPKPELATSNPESEFSFAVMNDMLDTL